MAGRSYLPTVAVIDTDISPEALILAFPHMNAFLGSWENTHFRGRCLHGSAKCFDLFLTSALTAALWGLAHVLWVIT